jgi:hypothetical protein
LLSRANAASGSSNSMERKVENTYFIASTPVSKQASLPALTLFFVSLLRRMRSKVYVVAGFREWLRGWRD